MITAPALTRHRLSAFGLEIESDWPLSGTTPCPPGSGTRLVELPPDRMEAEWQQPAETVFEPAYPDGVRRFAVERDIRQYRLWFADEGRFLVATDGKMVATEAGAADADSLERILLAQVLPFAAALQGYEVLHASAVAIAGGAVAFAGPAGSGKTSLAARLALRGNRLVTDDVLAIERRGDGLVCHPGPPLMVLAASDLDVDALGTVVGSTDKLHVAVAPAEEPQPLRTLVYLERGERLELSALERGDTERALASFFAPYLATPDRLRGHLDTALLLSDAVRQLRLTLPRPVDFDAALDLIAREVR